jgi:hypothetical protein
MIILGGILGVLFGLLLAGLVAGLLGLGLAIFGPLAAVLGPIIGPILAVLGAFSTLSVIIFGLVTLLILNIVFYILGAVALLPLTAAPPTGGVTNPIVSPPLELFSRGFIIGLTASGNFAVWAMITGNPLVGLPFGLVTLLAVILPLSRSFAFQVILGWISWALPMSYLVTPLGILLFMVNLLVTLVATGGLPGLRFDVTTATLETAGGTVVAFLTGLTGFTAGGFNLGNFTFLGPAATPTAFIPVPPAVGGLSTHETGHTLTIAALGGFYGWINSVDENIPPPGRLTLANGEMVPESHFARLGLFHVRQWS